MKARARARLRRAGWAVGSTADFIGLSADEATLGEMKLAMSRTLRA